MRFVMDSSSLIALLRDEAGAEMVADILSGADNSCAVHAVNMCEVFYEFRRSGDESVAQRVVHDLISTGLAVHGDMDTEMWQAAGRLKADVRRVSLADCFCLALADREDAEVVSADHHEFDAIAQRGTHAIRFIR